MLLDQFDSKKIDQTQDPATEATKRFQDESQAKELFEFYKTNREKLDLNNNGYVSKSELKTMQKSGRYSGKDLRLLNILNEKRHTLERMSDDEFFGTDNDGITYKDMDNFVYVHKILSRLMQEGTTIREFLASNFDNLDHDRNNYIGKHDLYLASIDPTRTESERTFARMLESSERYKEIMRSSNDEWGFENDGITKADLRKYQENEMAGHIRRWHPDYQEWRCYRFGLTHTNKSSFPTAKEILEVFAPKK